MTGTDLVCFTASAIGGLSGVASSNRVAVLSVVASSEYV